MEREALKLGLEALEGMQNAIYNIEGEHVIGLGWAIEQADVTEQAITAIKAALAQPAQDVDYWIREATAARQAEMALRRELEAKPVQEPVRLYVENFATKCGWKKEEGEGAFEYVQRKSYAQGLEDATPPPPAQEPVAVHQFRLMYSADWHDGHPDPKDGYGPYETRTLYTAPLQRERVVFPTMLRKMWSGGEVQAWLDENVNKEKNDGT
ncbi:hypothetical protein UFOVP10_7 [uncultured Caudovirales phage]|uniref:Uncharacterized protein n=1 Tax=uncultured Caudovirales phage TaxID=2100421 RepID=A0A6J5KJH7_9CAUD|nr:hypothetical protein UFOVP10_7 [uncultured Caudovirales phage]